MYIIYSNNTTQKFSQYFIDNIKLAKKTIIYKYILFLQCLNDIEQEIC